MWAGFAAPFGNRGGAVTRGMSSRIGASGGERRQVGGPLQATLAGQRAGDRDHRQRGDQQDRNATHHRGQRLARRGSERAGRFRSP